MNHGEEAGGGTAQPPAGRPWRLVIGAAHRDAAADLLPVGTPVMVRTQYLGSWTTGFVVAEQLEDGYRLRRLSDGSHLPGCVGASAVRPEIDAG